MTSTRFHLFNLICYIVSVPLLLLIPNLGLAEQESAAYYDFGVFAFEDGDYEGAIQNFEKAIQLNPMNPDYHHYLGKSFIKTEQYKKADQELNQAWQYKSNLGGLRYDMAFVQYHLGIYPVATFLFAEALAEDPSNVLAQYYIGICMYKRKRYQSALDNFEKAGQKSPSIRANGYFYAGICHMQLKNTKQAVEKFSWVAEHAEAGDLKTNAEKWLQTAQAMEKASDPLRLFLKISSQYDDNVRLEPLDDDIYSDEDDFGFTLYFSGKYRFIRYNNLSSGVGYNHYQVLQTDLREYNLMGSTPHLYLKYQYAPLIFSMTFQPSYYWLDSEKYMLRRQVNTDMVWNITEKFSNRYAINFYDETNYVTDGKSGKNTQISMDAFYRMPEKNLFLLGGIGFDSNVTDHPDYEYFGIHAKFGITLNLPWEIDFSPSGKIYYKKYQNTDSTNNAKRDDTKFDLTSSLSRNIVYKWAKATLEYRYTKNNSNFSENSYDSNKISLSVSASY